MSLRQPGMPSNWRVASPNRLLLSPIHRLDNLIDPVPLEFYKLRAAMKTLGEFIFPKKPQSSGSEKKTSKQWITKKHEKRRRKTKFTIIRFPKVIILAFNHSFNFGI
jgi:hypothetical protein